MPRAQINPEVRARLKSPQRITVVERGDTGPGPTSGTATVYHEAFLELVYKLCLLCATDNDIARIFEVTRDTVDRWYQSKPGFRDAVQAGRDIADANVAHSLYRRACGYSHPDAKIFYDKDTGEVVEVPYTKYYPPDTAAAALWLRARKRTDWFSAMPEPNHVDELPPPTVIYNPVTVKVLQQNVAPAPPKKTMIEIE